jgi:peroxiredoxin
MKPRRLRVFVLPLAAITIFAAVEYRLRQPNRPASTTSDSYGTPMEAPPPLEGTDSNNRYFRLDRYLGRQEVFVVFFDRAKGAEGDPVLAEMKKNTPLLKRHNVFVVAVSSALPQENRRTDFETPIPFVLVTDPDQVWKYHRLWGCLDEETGTAMPRTFFIDRAGRTQMLDGRPVPVTLPEVVARLDEIGQ